MNQPSNLNAVLHDLKSEKVKERQQGISSLRDVFSRKEVVLSFDKKGNGAAWLTVFQALFHTVGIEKTAHTKKAPTSRSATPGAAALRRLSDAANAVRWLIERSVERLNKSVVRCLLTHLLQTMVYNGELLAPVALDYFKALKCLLSWTPHMDHLNEETWVQIVEMAFNVILGDPVRRKFDDDDDDYAQGVQCATPSTEFDDSEFFLDDDKTDGSVVSDTQSKKRRRLESSSAPRTAATGPFRSTSKSKASRSVSPEQSECAALLTVLLQSSSAPFLSPDFPNVASAVLDRMHHFLERYPADSSLYPDYLHALSAALSQLSLNKKSDVENFARGAWNNLLGLWGTKNKSMKGDLVAVLHVLFPFFTEDQDGIPTWAEGIRKLWQLLDGEAENRWGAVGLSFDSLRLEVASDEEEVEDVVLPSVFTARTFRAGWHFNTIHALAWAVLELQADCCEKLFKLSESVHSPTARGNGKRPRLENPVTSLLNDIHSLSPSAVRVYHLQTLLFFVDKHWSILRDVQQQGVIDALLKFVSFEDVTIQSWTFLCLAAIAEADSSGPDRVRDPASWDPIWTHAIRRASSPGVCRAACHVAYILLSHTNSFITLPHVLLEIETLAKDLDVQGPTLPYDSVCMFFSQCLKVASQDVRLYRMQLEEKVLSWLTESWKAAYGQSAGTSGRSRLQPYMVEDVLQLLESICGLSNRCNLVSRVLLSDCPIVDVMTEQHHAKVIRDFLIYGRLPPFHKYSRSSDGSGPPASALSIGSMASGDLASPSGRERRISSFLQKLLESLASEFEAIKESNGLPSAEQARRALDLAVSAMAFESLLVLNGTLSNKRVIQCACKLVALISPLLTDMRWTVEEKALVLLGLNPLISDGSEGQEGVTWIAMLPPDANTGIRTQTLRRLLSNRKNLRSHSRTMSRNLRRILFLNADIQDTFTKVMRILRDILRDLFGQKTDDSRSLQAMDVDDKDGFEPIRTTHPPEARQQTEGSSSHRCIVEICISTLCIVPILQSSAGEPTRDKELTELMLGSDKDFHLIASVFLDKVGRQLLKLSVSNLDDFLTKIEPLLLQYNSSKSEKLQLLISHFLDSTLHIWLQDSVKNSEVGDNIRTLCHWISGILKGNKTRSWRLRDHVARFLDRYLSMDPKQEAWSRNGEDLGGSLPSILLPMLGADRDIRVRFRAAVANAHLFSVARTIGHEALLLYDEVKKWLTVDLHDYERMLTRMLALGNMMVVSSAVRRGPYWHMLEACFHVTVYSRHVEAILMAVSERLGLASFSLLFELYASQIAYSIRQAGHDFLLLPPHVLGFNDRKGCAEAVFRAFTPTNVLAGGPKPEAIIHGKNLFSNHCIAIQKSTAEGIRECLGDIVGIQIATWFEENIDPSVSTVELDKLLMEKTALSDSPDDTFDLHQNVDGVVAAILRTLGDQDFSQEGTIVQALRSMDDSGEIVQAFQGMVRYRDVGDFETHAPNLPAFDTPTILQALLWFGTQVPEAESRATCYHVLHELFTDVRQSPLVNEQIRLLNAITLWVARHHSDFEDTTLLYTLIHGATSLLAQPDLARAAQSLLEWAFSCCLKITQKDPRFPDILVRICCTAYDYSLDTEDIAVTKMGDDLLRWIDSQALALCKNVTHRKHVVTALLAWPQRPSPELAQVCEDVTSEVLSTVLSDNPITSNKFRLVKRLRDLAVEKRYNEDEFARSDFWRLKECIPPEGQLQDDDIIAFASLLILNKGHVYGFGSELSGLRARHRRVDRKKGSILDDSPQRTIITALLSMLDGNATTHVHVAYRTLRSVLTVSKSEIPQLQSWPSEYRQELEYLEAHPRPTVTRRPRDISELSTPESYQGAAKAFPDWITSITTLLCDILAATKPFYSQLTCILQSDIAFAEQMLPVLVHSVLQAEPEQDKKDKYRIVLSNYFASLLMSDAVSTPCLRSIINIVLHLRNFPCPYAKSALSHNKWLDIDFTLLARNAISCGTYTTSLLFLELAAEHPGSSPADDDIAERILFDIYSHIDEPDGFYGIKTKDLGQILIKRFHHEKQWEKAFRFHGAALEAGNASSIEAKGLLQSFHSFGFNHLAIDTLQKGSSLESGFTFGSSGMSYRLGWRTETWDLPNQAEQHNSGASLYHALRAVHRERNPQVVTGIVRRALSAEMERLRVLGPENLAEIREVTQNLMCLTQVTQWMDNSIQNQLKSKQIDDKDWNNFVDVDPNFEFSDLESILATRISLIRSVRQKEEREQIGTLLTPFAGTLIDIEKKCLVRLSEAARVADQIQIALNSVVRSQKLERTPSFEVSQEFASVLWLQREQKLAVQYLKQLVPRHDPGVLSDNEIKKALLLARLGTWSSEACLEKPTDILTQYFDPATSLVTPIDRIHPLDPTCAAVYHQCAIFAEHQYHAILKSPDAERRKVYADRKRQEIGKRKEQIQRSDPKDRNALAHELRKAQMLLTEDQETFLRHNGARNAFLVQAIDMFSRCLETSDTFDDDGAIRLCSLWFANFDDMALQEKVQIPLDRVPSRKLVFLAHQLSARMSKSQSTTPAKSQENLQRLVIRMCEDHPFHSLYQVYSLRPASSSTALRRHSSRHDPSPSQSERGAAACDIFDRLRCDPSNGERVRALERLCDASVEWAHYPIKGISPYNDKKRKGPFDVPEGLQIRRLPKLRVPVITVHTPLDPTLRYDNCIWIDRYETTFETAGGINLPKISFCRGSDGERYKQLFKGEGGDDLRQDAVMEQVFDLVNVVLRRDRETRRRNLRVRDYKVVPLSAQAGVLEFVGNTSPLQNWLIASHQKYRPSDMKHMEIIGQMKAKRKECSGREEAMLALFLDIRSRFKPVMRHYFTERHKIPISWFTMRLNYTRSVATTSIVGHVLGLGDRHTSNILMDNVTGEVIHIDLGIAFDQGKLLPVPERMPFRMTADMVDGMGISGTQGVFQRCAEETLRVLREGSEVIMTVLEVFKHDPLHSWTASELKLNRIQGNPPESTVTDPSRFGIGIDMQSGSAEEEADRALSSVARKLNKALSVEYTVNELITEATDQVNLATVYEGWGPHL